MKVARIFLKCALLLVGAFYGFSTLCDGSAFARRHLLPDLAIDITLKAREHVCNINVRITNRGGVKSPPFGVRFIVYGVPKGEYAVQNKPVEEIYLTEVSGLAAGASVVPTRWTSARTMLFGAYIPRDNKDWGFFGWFDVNHDQRFRESTLKNNGTHKIKCP